MLNRRTFLTRVAGGVVGACVLAKIPISALPASIQRYAAIDYLTKGCKRYLEIMGKYPQSAVVSSALMEAYESELLPIQRVTESRALVEGYKVLMFRGVRLYDAGNGFGSGWRAEFYGDAYLVDIDEKRVLSPRI